MCQTIGCCRGGRKFVCFDCRTTAKGLDTGMSGRHGCGFKTAHPNCPRCRKAMMNVGMGAKIPTKTNDRRWKSMYEWFLASDSGSRQLSAALVDTQ